MNKILYPVVIVLSVALYSCKKQPVSSTPPRDLNAELLANFHPSQIDFMYMTLRSKVEYTDEAGAIQFSTLTRAKKDSVLWFSISKANIEGVRAMIRPDSVFMLDRMNNNYVGYDMAYIQQLIQAGLTYENLQNLLVGNLMFSVSSRDRLIKQDAGGYYILNQKKDSLYITNYIRLDNLKLEKVNLIDSSAMSTMNVVYSNYITADSLLVPSACSMVITYNKDNKAVTKEINMLHSKMEFTDKPLNFPFNVPKKYENK